VEDWRSLADARLNAGTCIRMEKVFALLAQAKRSRVGNSVRRGGRQTYWDIDLMEPDILEHVRWRANTAAGA